MQQENLYTLKSKNMEYRIEITRDPRICYVWDGVMSYGDFVRDEVVYTGSLADCYIWIKAKQEGLFLLG